jgi:hypothetical protein
MADEEFDMLGEEDLTLLSRRFERKYTDRKNAWRSSGMCYWCGSTGTLRRIFIGSHFLPPLWSPNLPLCRKYRALSVVLT